MDILNKKQLWVSFVVLFSLASSVYHGVRLSPGWLFWDSASQWGWAYQLNDGFDADLSKFGITSQWPLFNTFFKLMCLKLGVGPSTYAVIQSFLTNLSIFYVLISFTSLGWYSVISGVLVCLTPFLINYGIFHSADTPAAIILLFMTAFALNFLRTKKLFYLYLASGLLALSLLFRYNFVSLLPLLFFIPVSLYRSRSRLTLRSCVAILLPLGVVASILGTRYFNVYPMDTAFHGVLMRNLSFLREKESSCIRNSIKGVFHNEERIFDDRCYRTVLCKEIYQNIKKEGSTVEQVRCFFDFAIKEPKIWIKNNLIFAGNFLGIQAPMDQGVISEIMNNTPSINDEYKMVFNPVRMDYWGRMEAYTYGFYGFLGRPYIMILIALFLSSVAVLRKKDYSPLMFCVAGLLYYSIFIVDGPDCVFRYYFPAFMCFLASVLIAIGLLSRSRVV